MGRGFRIVRLIHRGAVAETLEAKAFDGTRCVLKRLHSLHEDQDRALVDLFIDAAHASLSLRHPNLVESFDCGLLDDRPFLAMAHVEGADLETTLALSVERPPLECVLFLMQQIAHALVYLHEQGGAHSAIGLDKIMIAESGAVQLVGAGSDQALHRIAHAKGRTAETLTEDPRIDVEVLAGLLQITKEDVPKSVRQGIDDAAREGQATLLVSVCNEALARRGAIEPRRQLLEWFSWSDKTHAMDPSLREQLGRSAGKPKTATDDAVTVFTTAAKEENGPAQPFDLYDMEFMLDPGTSANRPRFKSVVAKSKTAIYLDISQDTEAGIPAEEGTALWQFLNTTQRRLDVQDTAPTNEPEGDPDDPRALIGQNIGGYRLEGLLGSGTYTHVYQATDQRSGGLCAMKVLRKELAGGARVHKRILREAAALQRLDHPNLVRIYDYGTTPAGLSYIAIELVFGRSLHEITSQGLAFELRELAEIAHQIADGLTAVHAAGLVHRDLGPRNIMLGLEASSDQRLVVKILDFGTVQITKEALTRLTMAGHLIGTPLFMAPEQIERPSDAGPAADCYSLGLIMYLMATGEHPFPSKTLEEILTKQRTERASRAEEAGPLTEVIDRLLEKNPADRPTAKEVAKEIARSGLRAPVGVRSRSWPWYLAAVTLLLLGWMATWSWAPNEAPVVRVVEPKKQEKTPAAKRRVVVQPRQEPVATKAPIKVEPKTRKPKRVSTRKRVQKLESKTRARLVTLGLTHSDLKLLPQIRKPLRALAAAADRKDLAEAQRQFTTANAAIDRFRVDATFLRKKLNRVLKKLRARSKSLHKEQAVELETVYLEIRGQLSTSRDIKTLQRLNRSANELERTIDRL